MSYAKVPFSKALWLAVLRRPVLGSVRWQANAQQSRSRSIRNSCLVLEIGMPKLESIEAVTTYVPRHRPK